MPEPNSSREINRSTGIKPERRHLTVLLCDIVDSTKLSNQHDPEDLAAILHEFQRCCADAIRDFDGYIAKFLGDGILAYFGFPYAHEEDAERAVYSALRMLTTVASLARSTPQIKLRIGIATGLV